MKGGAEFGERGGDGADSRRFPDETGARKSAAARRKRITIASTRENGGDEAPVLENNRQSPRGEVDTPSGIPAGLEEDGGVLWTQSASPHRLTLSFWPSNTRPPFPGWNHPQDGSIYS